MTMNRMPTMHNKGNNNKRQRRYSGRYTKQTADTNE